MATSLGTSTLCASGAGPPIAQPTPTRIRLMPMIAMMVPVTTGGKKRSSWLTTGAMSIETMPAPMIAPKIARAPSTPGIALAKATIGPTAAKVTPIITGSSDAEPAREAQRLHQRDEATAEQVGRDQQRHLLGRELERTADDQRHGDGAGVHHQHVLQAQCREARRRQSFVDRVDDS